jgi:hypothetical protein
MNFSAGQHWVQHAGQSDIPCDMRVMHLYDPERCEGCAREASEAMAPKQELSTDIVVLKVDKATGTVTLGQRKDLK